MVGGAPGLLRARRQSTERFVAVLLILAAAPPVTPFVGGELLPRRRQWWRRRKIELEIELGFEVKPRDFCGESNEGVRGLNRRPKLARGASNRDENYAKQTNANF